MSFFTWAIDKINAPNPVEFKNMFVVQKKIKLVEKLTFENVAIAKIHELHLSGAKSWNDLKINQELKQDINVWKVKTKTDSYILLEFLNQNSKYWTSIKKKTRSKKSLVILEDGFELLYEILDDRRLEKQKTQFRDNIFALHEKVCQSLLQKKGN